MANQKLNITIAAIDKTKGAFGSVTRSLGIASKALFSFKTAILGAVGVGGLGLLVRNSLLATDTLGKTATKLGVTTEALGAMRYAAELTGVATQTTDMAMQRFTRRLSEAAAGTGEAKGALRELNIDAEALVRLPLDQQMLEVADAFGNVENQADRVRLAFKLFDSEGVSLVNTLAQGKEALQAVFLEADNLGILMSTKAAQGVEKANDAFLRLRTLFGGIVDQTVGALAPALEGLATLIKDYVLEQINSLNGSVEEFGRQAANFILRSISTMLRGLANFVNGVQNTINSIERMTNYIVEFFGGVPAELTNFQKLVDEFNRAAMNVDSFAFAMRDLNVATTETNDKIPEQITMLQRVAKAFREATESTTTLQDSLNSAVKGAMKSTTDSLVNLVTGAQSAKDAFKNMATSIINDLIRMAIQKQITDRIFGFISTAISSASGSPSGSPPGGHAIGGSVQAGKATVVGERGAELFVPHSAGSIIPNDRMSGGGGDVVNVNLNLSTGVSQTVRAEVMNMLPMITNATKTAVIDAKRRGGSFARGLG